MKRRSASVRKEARRKCAQIKCIESRWRLKFNTERNSEGATVTVIERYRNPDGSGFLPARQEIETKTVIEPNFIQLRKWQRKVSYRISPESTRLRLRVHRISHLARYLHLSQILWRLHFAHVSSNNGDATAREVI